MTADLLALLNQLDELRAAATPGPWVERGRSQEPYVGSGLHPGEYGYVCTPKRPADTAAIVAAVNAVPTLTDALRRVLAGCDHLDRMRPTFSSAEARMAYADATKHIRACLTAALSPESVPS